MMNHQGQERRKSQRLAFREDILIYGARQCTCNDISEGGIFISAIQTFDEGEIIDVTIPIGEERITVKGQIKYCQQGIGIGVMFYNLHDEHKSKIKALVDCLSSSSH